MGSNTRKPKGYCTVYEQRPQDCMAYECGISPKKLDVKCRSGCVDCCIGRDVKYDPSSGLYVIEPGSKGPCSQLHYTSKPGWVADLEAGRDLEATVQDGAQDPRNAAIRDEERQRLMEALKGLPGRDRDFISSIFGLEGKPQGIEKASADAGLTQDEGMRRYARLMIRLRKRMGED